MCETATGNPELMHPANLRSDAQGNRGTPQPNKPRGNRNGQAEQQQERRNDKTKATTSHRQQFR